MHFKNYFHCLIFFIFSIPILNAQNIKWYAESESEVESGSAFEVSFTLTNAKGKNVQFPPFTGLNIVAGPSTGNSLSIINGVQTSAQSYTFSLMAEKVGDYVISPATIEVQGKIMKTDGLKVKIIKSNTVINTPPNGNIAAIAKMKVSPPKAYVGQQITAEYTIYYGENIGYSEEPIKPEFPNFFIKDLNVSQVKASAIKVGNKIYDGILVDAVALYPQKAGKLQIKPTNFKVEKQIPGTNPYANPFGSYETKILTTNSADVEIQALPQGPKEFSGGVGKYKMAGFVNAKNYTTDQSIVLRINVIGNGDSRQVGPPIQDFGNDFEVFPPKLAAEEEFIENNVVYHKKTFEYLISPKKEGNFSLNPKFIYFDTDEEQYKTIEITTEKFDVSKGSNTLKNLFSNGKTSSKENSSNNNLLFYILSILSCLALLAYFFFNKKKGSKTMSEEEQIQVKKENAAKLALEKLTLAKKYMDNHQYELFYREIGFAINNYLQSKYYIKTEDLNKHYIQQYLATLTSGTSTVEDYKSILEKADLSMYGGYSDKNVAEIFERANTFIANMEMQSTKS